MRGEETSPAQQLYFETRPVADARSGRRCATPRDSGFIEFVTGYVSRRKWLGREKKLKLRLFPSYLFRRFKLSDLFAILNSFGVIHVAHAGDKLLVVTVPVLRRGLLSEQRGRWLAAPASRNEAAAPWRLAYVQ